MLSIDLKSCLAYKIVWYEEISSRQQINQTLNSPYNNFRAKLQMGLRLFLEPPTTRALSCGFLKIIRKPINNGTEK